MINYRKTGESTTKIIVTRHVTKQTDKCPSCEIEFKKEEELLVCNNCNISKDRENWYIEKREDLPEFISLMI